MYHFMLLPDFYRRIVGVISRPCGSSRAENRKAEHVKLTGDEYREATERLPIQT
jgi:hypothetical protein